MIKEHPKKPALKDGWGNNLTYSQMGDRIQAISAALIDAGASTGTAIGVFQAPSSDWICSMLAILRVGATYVPLDLRNSIARIASIMEKVKPSIILTDQSTSGKVAQLDVTNITRIVVSQVVTTESLPAVPNRARPESQAIILFTSGTTGKPKGVVLTHSNLRAQCEGYSRMVGLPSMVRVVLQQTIYNFDVSLDQTFAALADGGCLYVVPAEKRGNPQAITKIIAEQGVTYTVATPSEYETWFRYAPETLPTCKSWAYAFGGGEHLHTSLIKEFANLSAQHIPNLRLFNNYGPTEASLAITKGEVQYSDPNLEAHVPAGWIIPNYTIAVVDEHLTPVPLETVGEIVVSGPGIAAGYLGQEELTREKFMPGEAIHPLACKGYKWYRTGDRGRLRPDGALYVDGRILGDTQVKIRGFRVELQEIENVLLKTAKGALSHAIVTLRGFGEDCFLTAHVVFDPEYPQHRHQQLIYHLESKLPLPSYMQPAIIVPLASIPVTSNFKFDRKAIQALPVPEGDVSRENLASMEKRVASLWRAIISHPVRDLEPSSNFFDIGGNSILLVKLQAAIKRELQSAPQLIDLINSSTLEGMARHIRAASIQNIIDWNLETEVPTSLKDQLKVKPSKSKNKNNLTVVVAGVTGYLGRHILALLSDTVEVGEIICFVRPESLNAAHALSTCSKVKVVSAQLSQPSLGLDPVVFADIAAKSDIVLHCAANRSFWDGYQALRAVNFDAVKELLGLCIPNDAALHFISSGAVGLYSNSAPPVDGSDGYIASKWAAERLLSKAASLGVKVYIHRPMSLALERKPTEALEKTHGIQDDLSQILRSLKKRPDFSAVSGYVDVAPVDDVASSIVKFMVTNSVIDSSDSAIVTEYRAHLRLQVDDFASHIEADEELCQLELINPLLWFAEAKKAGFVWLIVAQKLDLSRGDSGESNMFIVRR